MSQSCYDICKIIHAETCRHNSERQNLLNLFPFCHGQPSVEKCTCVNYVNSIQQLYQNHIINITLGPTRAVCHPPSRSGKAPISAKDCMVRNSMAQLPAARSKLLRFSLKFPSCRKASERNNAVTQSHNQKKIATFHEESCNFGGKQQGSRAVGSGLVGSRGRRQLVSSDSSGALSGH